jgi:hypothetical protein
VELNGTAKCEHCSYVMALQPSRIRNGQTLPGTFPVRRDRDASQNR